MKVVMTLMVRDEADIIAAMLEHHYAQGVAHIIATDNASVDGTTEILESYAARGLLTLHHDPRHEKQQAAVVTAMAREASTKHGATWVLNADADEFWVAEDHNRTLCEALGDIPTAFRAFEVPVIDMTGAPALEGSGFSRLTYRDCRSSERLSEFGLKSHAVPDVAFIGSSEVEVAQGNHFVNIESLGRPEAGQGIEVLHLPWRSWTQFSTKVRNAGESYARSGLGPIPNHQAMRDYRRLLDGRLWQMYLARHPLSEEINEAKNGELQRDERLARFLVDAVPDVLVDEAEWRDASVSIEPLMSLEQQLFDCIEARDAEHRWAEELNGKLWQRDLEIADLRREIENYRNRLVVRIADKLRRAIPRK